MDVLQRLEIVKLLDLVLKQRGKSTTDCDYMYVCPFHTAVNDVRRSKFGINIHTGAYNCFACGASGRSYRSFLSKLKVPADIKTKFYAIIGDTSAHPRVPVESRETRPLLLPDDFVPLYEFTREPGYKHALKYLFARGITTRDIVRYNIGYCASGQFANRIIVPSYDEHGQLNFYCGRDFYESNFKYRLCDSSKNIIGFELFTDFRHEITLVEGVFDAMSVRYNAVPLFGKTLSSKLKYKILDRRPPRVNVLLDMDAMKSSLKICDFLIQNNIDTHLVFLDGKDPNEIGHNITWQHIRNSVKMDESLIYRYKLQYKL